jgi:hypothetical protein
VFRYLLRLPDGEPNDLAVLVTAVPNWSVGETFLLSRGERACIVAIETEIIALYVGGFAGADVVPVEPVDVGGSPIAEDATKPRTIANRSLSSA